MLHELLVSARHRSESPGQRRGVGEAEPPDGKPSARPPAATPDEPPQGAELPAPAAQTGEWGSGGAGLLKFDLRAKAVERWILK